ncbi:protein of unknown function (plasmid) [Caballeronia sp. S22]
MVRQTAREPSPVGPSRATLSECHRGLASMAKLRVTAGLNKVTPAPGRGNANKPTRNRDPAKA